MSLNKQNIFKLKNNKHFVITIEVTSKKLWYYLYKNT
jgi:hypothetical protein